MNTEPKRKLTVLIVENNPVDTKMLQGMLSQSSYGSFDTQVAPDLEFALQAISQNSIDIALLDLNLPDSKGMQTLTILNRAFPHLPIVVNTGEYEDDVGLKAVTSGAQDYLIKGKYKSYGLSKSLYYAVERKKAEIDLQTAYNQLKETQAQLIQAEKMNVVGGLASGVAHEVRNPLATILYGIEFLTTKLTDSPDEQIQKTLQSIKDATHKANNIIKDLLDFASLSNLKIKAEDLSAVIEDAFNLVQHLCDRHKIKITKNFNATLPKVRIDRNRIEQVLVDLMLNAAHAMKETGGKLTVTAEHRKLSPEELEMFPTSNGRFRQGEKVLIVDIDDTGAGIPQEHLTKIYDPFFTTRRAAGGVGLGLSVARTIVENHHGLMCVGNLEEGGARARLVLKV